MNRTKLLLTAFFLLGFWTTAYSEPLKIYNWKNYIDTELVEKFEQDTGIDVQLTEYTTVEELELAIKDEANYDLVVPSHFQLPALIAKGRLEKLDTTRLPNHGEIDNSLLAALAAFNSADAYAIPYLWAAIGIAYDSPSVGRKLAGEIPQSWSMVFYNDYLEKLSTCGVSWLEAPKEVFSLKTNFVGGKLDHTSERRLEKYSRALEESVHYIRQVNNEGYIQGLATGKLCVAMAWSGHALAAKQSRDTINFMLPDEGGLLTIDTWAILQTSTRKDAAYQFINYMLKQESGRRNASATHFFSHLPPSVASNQGVGLNPAKVLGTDYRRKLYFVENLDPTRTQQIEAFWRSIKSNL